MKLYNINFSCLSGFFHLVKMFLRFIHVSVSIVLFLLFVTAVFYCVNKPHNLTSFSLWVFANNLRWATSPSSCASAHPQPILHQQHPLLCCSVETLEPQQSQSTAKFSTVTCEPSSVSCHGLHYYAHLKLLLLATQLHVLNPNPFTDHAVPCKGPMGEPCSYKTVH